MKVLENKSNLKNISWSTKIKNTFSKQHEFHNVYNQILNIKTISTSTTTTSNNNSSNITTTNTNTTTTTVLKKEDHRPFFKLPDHLNIFVIKDSTECNQILNELYTSLLNKMGINQDNSNQDENSNNNELMLFPKCNENNNHGLDFILGLDAEWGHTKDGVTTVALLQLSTLTNVYLIQLSQMQYKMPTALQLILQDPRLIKVGVAIHQDALNIFNTFTTITKSCVDLVPLAKLTFFTGNGLATIADSVMNVRLDKNYHIRCSEWGEENLSQEQIHYAAADAWVGLEIFRICFNTYRSRSLDPIKGQDTDCYSFIHPFLNTTFKVKNNPNKKKDSNSNSGSKKENVESLPGYINLKNLIPDRRVLYDNCLMLSPDNVLLCNISKKKVQWYVSRNLADIVNQEPLTIKLRFSPKGNGHADDEFYLANKENRCVVCASDYKLLRHSIVSHCYRTYFPVESKSHSSHDVVLLCFNCHMSVDKRLQIMKMIISAQYQVPIENSTAYIQNHTAFQVSKKALLLKNQLYPDDNTLALSLSNRQKAHAAKIPSDKLYLIKKEVYNYINNINNNINSNNNDKDKDDEDQDDSNSNSSGGDDTNANTSTDMDIDINLTLEQLESLISIATKTKDENFVSFEKKVMDKVLADGEEGLKRFIILWRRNFVETMQPKFLSPHWSVDK